ncbi:MAG TPA: DUF2663 family protein [Chondromyces sp.]|nr:DUF2663 family protein [Chondromyces sp.]
MGTSFLLHFKDTDHATKEMLQSLIERKKKFDEQKDRYKKVLWIMACYSLIYFYVLNQQIIEPYSHSVQEMVAAFFGYKYPFYLFIVWAGLFGWMNICRDRKDKAEEEFQALRCELVDRSKDLWKNEAWTNRHQLFEMMKKEYDINLYYETK